MLCQKIFIFWKVINPPTSCSNLLLCFIARPRSNRHVLWDSCQTLSYILYLSDSNEQIVKHNEDLGILMLESLLPTALSGAFLCLWFWWAKIRELCHG